MTDSPGHEIVQDKEPIRLFKSDFLEFFTHIHPALVALIWIPVSAYFMYIAIRDHLAAVSLDGGGTFPLPIVLGFPLGLFLWTLAEYLLHRFVFHFPPKTPRMERITFLFHGVHHAQPMCKTRLVMPPAASIPLAFLFYGLFYLIWVKVLGAAQWLAPTFSGFIVGYIIYDLTHYGTHHFKIKRRYTKFVKFNHMQHHFKCPDKRFGVSSPIWDHVFGTSPSE
jgi:sterol desaturase/sphingolipid hydroxylase (fatty acid hydroxylase superfamily)